MTARNIIIIVFVFFFLVVISAFVFGSRQNAAYNGMASIDQAVITQPLPPPSTVPPQGYITVPTAYYIGSTNTAQNNPAGTVQPRPTAVVKRPTPAPAPTVAPVPAPKPVDINYWYYRWNGNTYVPYYPYTPDHKAPVNAEDLAFYSQSQSPAPAF